MCLPRYYLCVYLMSPGLVLQHLVVGDGPKHLETLKKGRHPVTTVTVSLKRSPCHRSNVQTHKCKCRFPTIQFESDELRLSTESVNQDWSTWSVFKPWQPMRSFPRCDVLSRIHVSSAEFYGSTLFLSGSFPHTFGKGMKWFLMLPS